MTFKKNKNIFNQTLVTRSLLDLEIVFKRGRKKTNVASNFNADSC